MAKYIMGILLISLAAFFFWPVNKDSKIIEYRHSITSKVTNSVTDIGKSNDELKEELELKKAQLEAWEKGLEQTEANIQRMYDEAPVCPRTGQKAIITLTQDPRPEIRAKIEGLREEIRVLESKVSGS